MSVTGKIDPQVPLCTRAAEITAGSWIMAHNDGRKLDYHTDEGVGFVFEDRSGRQTGKGFKTWTEVRTDLVRYAHGNQLPIRGKDAKES